MIRIVLVDDHELVRTGFRLILEQQADIEVVGEASDGEQGLALLRTLKPDIALVDVHMPGVSGIEVTERVRKLKLKTRVVIVTMVSEAPFPRRLLEAGASGYITKSCSAPELLKAVRQVADGRATSPPVLPRQWPWTRLMDPGNHRSRSFPRANSRWH
jgi:two-component system, NarL family, invasion response regulator UvrY